jgi:nucleoside-diphosphate-sugar epimerase
VAQASIVVMRVLVVGGSGYLPGLVMPLLGEHHLVRVLDPRPPGYGCEYVCGDATRYPDVRRAVQGVDVVIHAATGSHDADPAAAASLFDVNVTSVYLTLLAAHDAGVPHAVYVSSLSVYRDIEARALDESVPADADDAYGLSKRLGEEVCQAAARQWGLSANVLRVAFPTADAVWPAWGFKQPPRIQRAADGRPIHATAATDLARAVIAAIDYRDGFQVFIITGDRSARLWDTAKARRLLGWTPTFTTGGG